MRIHTHLACALTGLWLLACPGRAQGAAPPGAGVVQASKEDLQRLRDKLAQAGPEGAEAREAAIEQLLSSLDEGAHALLQARLADAADPDQVRAVVLQALARRLLNPSDAVFGPRPENGEARTRVVRGYVHAVAGLWSGTPDADGLLPADPLRDLARQCLLRMSAGELRDALRALASAAEAPLASRVAALRMAGDGQNLQFGPLLADHLESPTPELQAAARTALRYLTFVDTPFERREQYQSWHKANGNRRYLELAEDAARAVARRSRQFAQAIETLRREDAAEFVRAVTERRGGVDWAAVQIRTLSDDAATLSLCLQQLQRTLADGLPAEDGAPQRAAFARALLARFRATPVDDTAVRGALLEVAAYLCRPNESELVAEVAAEILPQLQLAATPPRLAALRALRRFPSPEHRAVVVALVAGCLQPGQNDAELMRQALQTLAWTKDTPWRAPAEGAPDKAAWLQMLRAVCAGVAAKEHRTEGLAVALLPDRDGKRVPEVFDLLLELARDRSLEAPFRTQCLIRLQDWRDQEARADVLVRELALLLADDERDVRLYAAEALSRLPEAPEERKRAWQKAIVLTLRERLKTEANPAVLRAMVDCLSACGRDPGSPEAVIGALNYVLDGLGAPLPAEQQARAKTLLAALPTVAADPRAEVGQWIGACEMLVRHEERRSLRHVLESHNAVLLAKDLGSADVSAAERARRAVRLVLLAALLKPAKEPWTQNEELKREAEDVRAVFAAVAPGMPFPENLQEPRFRLLRLEVLAATGRTQEALAFASACLAEIDPKDHKPLDPAQQDAVRILAAEASLADGRTDQAADWLAQVDPTRATEPRALDVAERTSRAFAATNPAKAVALLERILRATAPDDPAYCSRLLAMLQARLRANPAARPDVLAELDRNAALFQGPDCPEPIKEAVARLRSGN